MGNPTEITGRHAFLTYVSGHETVKQQKPLKAANEKLVTKAC